MKKQIIRGSVVSFILRGAGVILTFLSSVIFARLLNVAEYGTYEYVVAWMNVLVVPAVWGMDHLLIRNIATYHTQLNWGMMKGLVTWSRQLVLFISFILAFAAGLVAWVWADFFVSPSLIVFWWGCALIPLTALLMRSGCILRGLHYINEGLLPQMLLQPLFVVMFSLFIGVMIHIRLNALWGVTILIVSTSIALVVATLLVHWRFPSDSNNAVPVFQRQLWFSAAVPIVLNASMALLINRLDILMLGAMTDAETVGIYAVASRITEIITFVLITANTMLAPTFASLYAQQNIAELERVAVRSSQLILLGTLPIVGGLILFSPWILRIFGTEFVQAQTILMIIAIGQMVNVAMGSVNVILLMTGYVYEAVIGIAVALVCSIGLNLFLIPTLAGEGAAIAKAVGLIVWNVLLALWIYHRIGIHTTALGGILRRVRGNG